jgi:hypothetical protein
LRPCYELISEWGDFHAYPFAVHVPQTFFEPTNRLAALSYLQNKVRENRQRKV